MSVVIQERHVNDVCVIAVSGRLTLGHGMGTLRTALRDKVAHGEKKILLHLGGLTQLDSAGIGVLVSSFATANNHGGQLKLLNVTDRVKDLLLLTKLCTVFEIYDDEAAALASFSGATVPAAGD